MTRKVYKQKMFFSILTKNLNWENLVTFKRWDGIRENLVTFKRWDGIRENLVTFKRWDGIRIFQIVVKGGGKFPSVRGESEILRGEGHFFTEESLRRSDLDYSNLFQS